MDRDTDLDLVLANVNGDDVSILVNLTTEPVFGHGDANCDGVVDLVDLVYVISYLYKAGPAPNPLWVGVANCDEIIDLEDVIYLINYLYKGGPPPAC